MKRKAQLAALLLLLGGVKLALALPVAPAADLQPAPVNLIDQECHRDCLLAQRSCGLNCAATGGSPTCEAKCSAQYQTCNSHC